MIQDKKELRNKARIAFRIPAIVMGSKEKAQISDFSLSGFFVQMESIGELKRGQQVRLALRFPHEKKSTVIKVKIVRTEKNGFGCRFVELDPVLYEQLDINFSIFSATLPIE